MKQFRSKVYVCTATAARWDIKGIDGQKYDEEAARVRHLASDNGITGKDLWEDLRPLVLKKNAFHHGEPGKKTNLCFIWDRVIHRI
eukprot:3006763-Heterocapsa_arctica.AAC.1